LGSILKTSFLFGRIASIDVVVQRIKRRLSIDLPVTDNGRLSGLLNSRLADVQVPNHIQISPPEKRIWLSPLGISQFRRSEK
jgi:hypothetical protein